MAGALLLLYFFVFFFFVVVSRVPAPLLLAAAAADGGCTSTTKTCGSLNISAPFGLVDESEENNCGLQMGFQVHCTDKIPYLGFYERQYRLQILHIFYGNFSLLVSDAHKFQDFNRSSEKGCHVPTANSTSKLGLPFSNSPLNQNLIFYNCTKAPPPPETVSRDELVETVCRNNTFVRAGGQYNGDGVGGGYELEGCNSIAVPVLGKSDSGKVNASDYLELIRNGFLLTWQPPPQQQQPGPQPQAAGSGGKFTEYGLVLFLLEVHSS
ncbi:hypothetical protein BRADI_2g02432v3 [Brachypodium distachyon]|uniref:Wall-associated receptor kinase galacturonan-binding domain-containing protein n=1 Tax=Brachypodium distachyon TaxID=15368 RepID=A0A0Q3FTN0_BRADI|nr:hypothetical protein BRADI_2g02432v3 [Brachypodium distachyon]